MRGGSRFIWVLPAVFAAAACPSASPPASPGGKPDEPIGDTMDSTEKRVAEKLSAFDSDQDPTRIEEAFKLVEDANRDVTPGDRTARKKGLRRWLRFLAALDREIDPNLVHPETAVPGAPLPPVHGPVMASGEVDPATIPDPVARAAYVRALQESKEKHRHFFAQTQLRRIDDKAMLFVKVFLASNYTSSEADRQEMEGLFSQPPLSEPRRERLRAVRPGHAAER
jgi:hypothetical protein